MNGNLNRRRAAIGTGALLLFGAGAAATATTLQPPSSPASSGPLPGLHDPRETHLKNVRQLTFGGQNAEAYWSFNGEKLIFQRADDEHPADRIYTMKADGSERRMVSTGTGRTTCAFFLPGDREIIFSSTHGHSPDVPPPPDRSQGYVWAVYPTFAIWRANADGSNLRPFFPKSVRTGREVGYNAEATVSPDGKKIIFTSTRDGDLELYSMNIDGTGLRRLTNKLGYDGGAFFSPDSRRIVWRAGYPQSDAEAEEYKSLLKQNLVKPSRMEIWVADADGKNARQVTNNGAANFAPFFTPDGKKILFASNQGDPSRRTFELYLINTDGTGQERVTYGQQFDSFPMFSPDGKRLVWASNRNGKNRETNIFVADWIP